MKKQKLTTLSVLSLIFIMAFIFIGCQKESGIVPTKASDTQVARSNAAQSYMFNEVVDYDEVVWVPCANGGAGENVHLQGELHLIFRGTLDDNGGFHGKYFLQLQGISGTGEITGDKYQGSGVTQGENSNSSTNIRVVTFINNFNVIGQGNGNNLLVHQTVHFAYNANNELTATVDNLKVECK
jgi:hypothetical protein